VMYREPRETDPLLSGGRGDILSDLANQITTVVNSVAQYDRNVKLLGTARDTSKLRESIRQDQHDLSRLIKSTTEIIKRAKDHPDKTRFQKLFVTFQDQVKQFQRAAEDFAKKERQHAPVMEVDQPRPVSVEDPLDKLNLILIDEEEHDRRIIQDRNQGIQQITEDLTTLHEIFADVAKMVQEQGEEIQNVEEVVATTNIEVAEAVSDLREASNLKQSARRKKVCIFIVVLVILVIGAAVIAIIVTKA